MIKFLQKINIFYASKFQAAVKAMQESCKQPWAQKVSEQQKNRLWALYKQATQGDKTQQMSQDKGKFPNMGSPMSSFRSMEGRQTVQGATQGDILKQQLKTQSNMSQNKTYFNKNAQNTVGDGMKPNTQQQTLQKNKTNFSKSQSKGQNINQSSAQNVSQQGYGNRTGGQFGNRQEVAKMQKKGSDTGSPQDNQRNKMWDKSNGKSKEQAENEYVKLAKDILQRNKANKYLKDL